MLYLIFLVLQGFLWKYRNVGVSPCAYPSVNRATAGGLPLQKSTKIIEEPSFFTDLSHFFMYKYLKTDFLSFENLGSLCT